MTTQTYTLTGITCSGCEAKVTMLLQSIPHVRTVQVSKEEHLATITMQKPITIDTFQAILPDKYRIEATLAPSHSTQQTSWIVTYTPILLIFGYITFGTLLIQLVHNQFDWIQWMQHFMAGFFLVFSFFKLLNIKAFSESYAMYDIVAKRFSSWGYVYPFIELVLGILYLIQWNPFITHLTTCIIMTISMIGVLQSVYSTHKIQCACLGAVFNLPMSTITIIEDALMVGMSGFMLIH